MHTAKSLELEPSPFEAERTTEKLKRYTSVATHKILGEMIQAGGNTLQYDIYSLIHPVWNKAEIMNYCKHL
jgi:hypothetical protein